MLQGALTDLHQAARSLLKARSFTFVCVVSLGLGNIAYVYGAAIAILVAVIASLAPARRAASVDPAVAMRSL